MLRPLAPLVPIALLPFLTLGCPQASSSGSSGSASATAAATTPPPAASSAAAAPSAVASAKPAKTKTHRHHHRDKPAPAAAASSAPPPAPPNPMDAPIVYDPYGNSRFCFTLDVPRGMVADPPPENGDGQTWHSKEGSVEIEAFGSNVVDENDTLDSAFAEESKDDPSKEKKVTLKLKEKDFFVVSGFEGSKIFYEKVFYVAGDHSVTFEVTYPAAAKEWWNRATDHMSKSFTACH